MGGSQLNYETRNDTPSGKSRRKKVGKNRFHNKNKLIMIICLSILGILVLGAGIYTVMGQRYKQAFFPHTVINGLDASGRSVAEVEAMITAQMDGYVLTLNGRDGMTEQIAGHDIDLHAEFDGTLQQILEAQEPMRWAFHKAGDGEYTIETMIAYDQDLLRDVFDGLDIVDESKTTAPADAYLSAYQEGSGYQIVPEQQGTRLIREVVWEEITGAILNLQDTVMLEELDAYEKPQVTAEDEALLARADEWNRYVGVKVTYQFGDQNEVLDASTIQTWLSDGSNHNVVLDDSAVAAYVKGLADKYNTAYTYKSFKTSYGPTVTIRAGNYGWRINQSAESAALAEIIRSGESQTREPVYSQTAASHTAPDYGNTYVEINLTAQHLYFYKDGKLIVESDFVSGNDSRGWATPPGAFPLNYKQRNATLRGEGYASPVSYWMPYFGGVGMHDAGWRNSFGGAIYKTSGSHGCINLPPAVAQIIYENITAGDPILSYHLEGTESKASAAVVTDKPPETAPESSAVQPTESSSAPQETSAAPVETSPQVPEQTSPAADPTSPTPEQTTPAATESTQTPVPPKETETGAVAPSVPQESAAGPGGNNTSPNMDSGVVGGPGM